MSKNNSNKESEKMVMRHILEVKLSKRIFSFMDFSGSMIDFFIDKLNLSQVKMYSSATSRFDLASDDLGRLYFFSNENFGFQIDASDSFENFKKSTAEFLETLNLFSKYKWSGDLLRIGTKTSVLYHKKGESIESLKQKYQNLILANSASISELTKSDIIDTSHVFDLKVSTGVANVLTGPVTKEEAIQKFYGGSNDLVKKKFDKNNGLMFSIDVFNSEPIEISDLDDLKERINLQINDIENIFNGFKTHFTKE